MGSRPVNRLPAPTLKMPEDTAFRAEVEGLVGAGTEVLGGWLSEELAAWSAEDALMVGLPEPGTEGRQRLDAWWRARNRRAAALVRALQRLGADGGPVRPANVVGESPCELAEQARREAFGE